MQARPPSQAPAVRVPRVHLPSQAPAVRALRVHLPSPAPAVRTLWSLPPALAVWVAAALPHPLQW